MCKEEPAHWKRPWCWERLKAKGERDGRGWDRLTQLDMNLSKLQEIVKYRGAWHVVVHGNQRVEHDLVTEQYNNKEREFLWFLSCSLYWDGMLIFAFYIMYTLWRSQSQNFPWSLKSLQLLWFKIWKGVHQGFILLPILFNIQGEYITWNVGLDDT